MAYLAFDEIGAVQQPVEAPTVAPVPSSASRLSALEWAVVALARNDRLSSLAQPSRLSTALGNVFGKRANPRLADPRLEALRRMAVLSWHYSFTVPTREIKAFLAAGFTADQYETLLASISAATASRARR